MNQQIFRVGPTLVLFTDKVLDRHLHVREPDLVHLMGAFEQDDRAHFDAGCVHVDQQEGNALLLLAFLRRAHEAENPVGVLAKCRPRLLAVDDVMVAFTDGTRLQRGEIGTGTGLGIALAPPVRTVENTRQIVVVLLF